MGTRLGPYEIDRLIAAGGMGEVYRAIDTRLRRKVAVKVLPPEFAADPERLRRFQLEAEAVAALNHPNILAIHDVGAARRPRHRRRPIAAGPPVHYLVTELLEGETLRERIARGPLPVCRTRSTSLCQMARALAAAHDKNIVHRDLKPSNVFLTAGGQVKLLDFGIAKVIGPAARESRASAAAGDRAKDATGPRMGTVGYSSPEQVKGLPTDARSDIFSFGAVLYEMLTGRRAFAGDTAEDVLSAILTKEPPPLAEACHNAPIALQKIVSRALAKRAEDRFPSARALEHALEPLSKASGRPPRSRLTPGGGRHPAGCGRRRRSDLPAAIAVPCRRAGGGFGNAEAPAHRGRGAAAARTAARMPRMPTSPAACTTS